MSKVGLPIVPGAAETESAPADMIAFTKGNDVPVVGSVGLIGTELGEVERILGPNGGPDVEGGGKIDRIAIRRHVAIFVLVAMGRINNPEAIDPVVGGDMNAAAPAHAFHH